MMVEDVTGDVEQVADQRVAQRVADRRSFFLRRDDVLVAEHRELLRDDRLIEGQRVLQLLNGASAADEDFQDSDPNRMRQRPEELGFEDLQFADRRRCGGPAARRRRH